jgi:hypothetical protein
MDGVRKDDLMAKRKAARAGAKKAGGGRTAAGRKGTSARKAAPRRAAKATKKAARKAARPAARTAARKTAKRAAPKAAARKATARKAPARKATRKQAAPAARRKTAKTGGRSAAPVLKKRSPAGEAAVPLRKAPALNRERRVIQDDDDIVQSTPPSSLDLDRTASSARSGRRSLRDRYDEHTETSPALTGGDVDADWESAYSVGDEAPGGDNPTPDQDIVDDIGRAVGVEYQDNEELKGADKVAKRDKNRWELDPASSDDWDDR